MPIQVIARQVTIYHVMSMPKRSQRCLPTGNNAPMLRRTSLQFAKELLMLALVSQAVVNSIDAIAHVAFEIADPV